MDVMVAEATAIGRQTLQDIRTGGSYDAEMKIFTKERAFLTF